MQFEDYQTKIREFAKYPEKESLAYLSLGLNGEAGEVAEKVKKLIRDGIDPGTQNDWTHGVMRELGDALWYIAELATFLGYRLDEVASANIEKLEGRKNRGALGGSGDNR
jgi:NTP pyrophosphatase (non-canonical NTP hydrolase)